MNHSEKMSLLWQQINHASIVDDVVQALEQVETATSELTSKNKYDLRLDAFRVLSDLTVDEPDQAENLILKSLLPLCVMSHIEELEKDSSIFLLRSRDILVDWLNQYAESVQHRIRGKILDTLLAHLASDSPEGACWTIGRIGFRRDDVVEALQRIAQAYEDRTGDEALYTLIKLGLPSELRQTIVLALHERAPQRFNMTLAAALGQLAEPSSVTIIAEHWLGTKADELSDMELSMILGVLAKIAGGFYAKANIPEQVWQLIMEMAQKYNETVSRHLSLGGMIAPSIDSIRVVPDLLELLAKESSSDDRAGHTRYLVGLRLEASVRPRQLKGWIEANDTEAIKYLWLDACQDTGYTGHASTEETLRKRASWNTLLRSGNAQLLSSFEECVANETNAYVFMRMCKQLACFALDPLPASVIQLITEPYDSEKELTPGEKTRRMAVIDIAQSAASWEALNALLGFGYTHKGQILKRSLDAIVAVAIKLAREDRNRVLDLVWQTTTKGAEKRNRTAAAMTLRSLATAHLLSADFASKIAPLLFEEEREIYERGTLAAALGYFPYEALSSDTLDLLVSWASEPDGWLGGGALEALARNGYLLEHPNLLDEYLGLQKTDDKWDLLPEVKRSEWSALAVALLYTQQPNVFAVAVASIIRTGSWRSVVQVLQILVHMHASEHHSPSDEICSAIIDRIHKRHGTTYTETDVFGVLGSLNATKLAEYSWPHLWTDWLPEARTALADSLGETKFKRTIDRSRAVSHLLLLARDGQYSVRRAAFRALSQQSPDDLEAICLTWADAPETSLRARAAEACAWFGSSKSQKTLFSKLFLQLVADRELIVRETVERSHLLRNERRWTKEYLSRVRKLKHGTNEEILSAWPYAQALGQIGDDTCLRKITQDLASHAMPPHVQHWFQEIRDSINEHWQKTTQDWPEPWVSWEGAIERGDGAVLYSTKESISVEYLIWLRPASTSSQTHDWGGTFWTMSGLYSVLQMEEKFVLRLEDGRTGEAIPVLGSVGSNRSKVVFLGSGPFPE